MPKLNEPGLEGVPTVSLAAFDVLGDNHLLVVACPSAQLKVL